MSYLQRIEVRNHYKLKDFAVDFQPPSGGRPFRHLILTGPNGSRWTLLDNPRLAGPTLRKRSRPMRLRSPASTTGRQNPARSKRLSVSYESA
jgi:hypothetical protein